MTEKKETAEELNRKIGQALVLGRIGQWVVQRTSPGYANFASHARPRRQIRRWVRTPQAGTPAQVRTQSNFRDAAAAWRALPEEQKAQYRRRARRYRTWSGMNLFISENIARQKAKGSGGAGERLFCAEGAQAAPPRRRNRNK